MSVWLTPPSFLPHALAENLVMLLWRGCWSEALCMGMALLKLSGIGMRLDGAVEVRMVGFGC